MFNGYYLSVLFWKFLGFEPVFGWVDRMAYGKKIRWSQESFDVGSCVFQSFFSTVFPGSLSDSAIGIFASPLRIYAGDGINGILPSSMEFASVFSTVYF